MNQIKTIIYMIKELSANEAMIRPNYTDQEFRPLSPTIWPMKLKSNNMVSLIVNYERIGTSCNDQPFCHYTGN